MKRRVFGLLAAGLLFAATAYGQSTIKGMSLNGTTGLIATPTAQIGWERSSDLGLDFGYHWVKPKNQDAANIPKASLSLFRKAELSFAYDSMGGLYAEDKGSFLGAGKFQFFNKGPSATAIGANIQMIEAGGQDYQAFQIYLAATYGGEFFGMPATTTVVFGKTFGDTELGIEEGNIDFSMGFELSLFPKVLQGHVQWINDFSNYSYSAAPTGAATWYRGAYNTGIRIDPLKHAKYKFVIDAVLADVFDEDDRAFILGATFGLGLK